MRPRISIRGFVRPYVCMSVCPYVRMSVLPSVNNFEKPLKRAQISLKPSRLHTESLWTHLFARLGLFKCHLVTFT